MNAASESMAIDRDLSRADLAEAVVFDRDHVLLIRRRDVPVWSLPGGHRDPGETTEASCVREVEEETGLTVRIVEPLGGYDRPYWLSGGRAAVYRCELDGGSLSPGENEGEARFWPVAALPKPILYWYPPVIHTAYDCARNGAHHCQLDSEAVTPTLGGFLRSLLKTPRLWLPLARYAILLHASSRIAQRRARRKR